MFRCAMPPPLLGGPADEHLIAAMDAIDPISSTVAQRAQVLAARLRISARALLNTILIISLSKQRSRSRRRRR